MLVYTIHVTVTVLHYYFKFLFCFISYSCFIPIERYSQSVFDDLGIGIDCCTFNYLISLRWSIYLYLVCPCAAQIYPFGDQ